MNKNFMLYFEASSIFMFISSGEIKVCCCICDLVNMQFYVLKKYYSSLLNSIRAHTLILCVKYTTEIFFLYVLHSNLLHFCEIFVKSLFSFFQKISLHTLNICRGLFFCMGGIYVLFAFSNISTPSKIL